VLFPLGSELSRGGLVQRKEMESQAQAVIDRLGAQFKASDRVMKLTIAEQQQVEIARALHRSLYAVPDRRGKARCRGKCFPRR
jgi:ABC-type sugar transport system ATPase subunit